MFSAALVGNIAKKAGCRNLHFDSISIGEICSTPTESFHSQVIDYYSRSLPATDLQVGEIRLLGKKNIMEEARNLRPGCAVSEFGFIPIAANNSGDIYVVDCRSGSIFEVSNEKYNLNSISPGWKPDYSGFMDDLPITRSNIIGTAGHSFPEIKYFLKWLTALS